MGPDLRLDVSQRLWCYSATARADESSSGRQGLGFAEVRAYKESVLAQDVANSDSSCDPRADKMLAVHEPELEPELGHVVARFEV